MKWHECDCAAGKGKPLRLSPLSALLLAVLLWAGGILVGSYLREGDMALSCSETGRYTLKGERYTCRPVGDKRPEPGRARGR